MARVLVLRTAGTNCDEETALAFRRAGADRVERVHVGAFLRRERELAEFDILALPGGFSYGDDLGAGTVLASRIQSRLAEDLRAFAAEGRPVLGICNGFQVLVRLGILPGWDERKAASLIENVSARFEDRWVRLRVDATACPFLGDAPGRVLRLPVAHREGRFVLREPGLLEGLRERGQIALTYCRLDSPDPAEGRYPDNPNGSVGDIAGISNEQGNVLGMMPHPERFLHRLHDPNWTREVADAADRRAEDLAASGDGYSIFARMVERADARVSTGPEG